MAELTGKVAWVTGAGTGIGSRRQALADAGAHVVLSGRRAPVLEEAAAAIKKSGGKAEALGGRRQRSPRGRTAAADIIARHKRLECWSQCRLHLPKRC